VVALISIAAADNSVTINTDVEPDVEIVAPTEITWDIDGVGPHDEHHITDLVLKCNYPLLVLVSAKYGAGAYGYMYRDTVPLKKDLWMSTTIDYDPDDPSNTPIEKKFSLKTHYTTLIDYWDSGILSIPIRLSQITTWEDLAGEYKITITFTSVPIPI